MSSVLTTTAMELGLFCSSSEARSTERREAEQLRSPACTKVRHAEEQTPIPAPFAPRPVEGHGWQWLRRLRRRQRRLRRQLQQFGRSEAQSPAASGTQRGNKRLKQKVRGV